MKTFPLLILLLVFQACTEKIDFELFDSDLKRVVVEGKITDQSKKHLVKLSYTSSYYSNEAPEAVSGAEVSISDGVQVWILTEQPTGSGLYYTADDVAGTVGKNHKLTIVHQGDTYEASDFMNEVTNLDAIEYEKITIDLDEDEDPYYEIRLTFDEPLGEDFYGFLLYVNSVTSQDTLENFEYYTDDVYEGAPITNITFFEEEDIEVNDTVRVEITSITEQAYDTYIALNLETNWRGGLFDSAPANVQTNVTNGALGFFGASAVSSKTMIIEE